MGCVTLFFCKRTIGYFFNYLTCFTTCRQGILYRENKGFSDGDVCIYSDKYKRTYHFNRIDGFWLAALLNKIIPFFLKGAGQLKKAHGLLAGMQSTL